MQTIVTPEILPEKECRFFIDGPVGKLETISLHANKDTNKIGVMCHPHPLFEGSMHNKIVHTITRAWHKQGIHALRFNFRGVGESEGLFGESVGEIEDCMAVINWLKQIMPDMELHLAGFSFGSYVAASCAEKTKCHRLFSVAPAVHHQPFDSLTNVNCPWLVVQGTEDEVVPPEEVYSWFARHSQIVENMNLIKIPDASHFFHGKLIKLRTLIAQVYNDKA